MKCGKWKRMLSLMTTVALILSMMITVGAEEVLTRGEFSVALAEMAGVSGQVSAYLEKDSKFDDVEEDSTYEGYANLVMAKRWMTGVDDGIFAADQIITQVEALTAIMRYLDIPTEYAEVWPDDYSEIAEIAGLTDGYDYDASAALTGTVLAAMQDAAANIAGKPLIGISWKSDSQDYSTFHQIIENNGGVPFELPQITSAEEAAEVVYKVDGMIVTGGQDINPDLYGDDAHPMLEDNNEDRDIRDTSDINLIQQAVAADVPMLAICRGMQMLNVAMGGGMIQDIPSYLEVETEEYDTHRVPASVEDRDYARHEIYVTEDAQWLSDIIGGDYLDNVPSWHHQAVDPERIGEGLTVAAYGPEDIIEAIEYQANEFTLGIQFHPERDALGENALCDIEICNYFFETLISYADESDKTVIGLSWKSYTQNYTDLVEILDKAGAVAVILPQITTYEEAVAALETVDGIIMTGGEDINPALYGDEQHPMSENNTDFRDIRDTSDYNLILAAIDEDVPMLAICRGMQMMNVALGGAMIQDLPSYLDTTAEEYTVHRRDDGEDYAFHDITIEKGTLWLEEIVGDTELENVPSWHHQAIDPERVAESLTIAAYGPDDVIEAVEYQDNEFALGIQFHPERDALGGDAVCDVTICLAFFQTLVEYASN